MSNILVTTMGLSWHHLPQVLGITNPYVVDLFRFQPSNVRISRIREEFDLQPVDEIWVVTTQGKIDLQLAVLQKWHALLEPSSLILADIKEWAGLIDNSFWPVSEDFSGIRNG